MPGERNGRLISRLVLLIPRCSPLPGVAFTIKPVTKTVLRCAATTHAAAACTYAPAPLPVPPYTFFLYTCKGLAARAGALAA
jgi:hypothetical protein